MVSEWITHKEFCVKYLKLLDTKRKVFMNKRLWKTIKYFAIFFNIDEFCQNSDFKRS